MDSATPTLEIEPYYTAVELAKLLDPTGTRVKPRSIQTEREKGRLTGTQIAGKWLYKKSDVLVYLEQARCPAEPHHPNLNPSSAPAAPRSGPSSTARDIPLDAGQRAYLSPDLTRSVKPKRPSSSGKKTAKRRKGPPAQVIRPTFG